MDQDYMPLSSQILYYILCNHSFLTIAIITMLCCLFIILTFIAYSKLRKQPGDILLSIAIADFFVGAVYFANALYTSLEMQSPTGTFC